MDRFFTFIISIQLIVASLSTVHAQTTAAQYDALVKGLVSKNEAPVKTNRGELKFGDKFDWPEQTRIEKTAHKLLADIDHSWPALVKGLDDERYATSVQSGETMLNHSVGMLCRLILREALAAPIRSCSPPDERITRDFWNVRMFPIDGPQTVEKWFVDQQKAGKSFHELQIQTCEWAISHVKATDRATDEEKAASVTLLTEVLQEMKAKKAAIGKRSLTIPEHRWIITSEPLR